MVNDSDSEEGRYLVSPCARRRSRTSHLQQWRCFCDLEREIETEQIIVQITEISDRPEPPGSLRRTFGDSLPEPKGLLRHLEFRVDPLGVTINPCVSQKKNLRMHGSGFWHHSEQTNR